MACFDISSKAYCTPKKKPVKRHITRNTLTSSTLVKKVLPDHNEKIKSHRLLFAVTNQLYFMAFFRKVQTSHVLWGKTIRLSCSTIKVNTNTVIENNQLNKQTNN